MRKKFLTMALVGAMALSITACGGKETEESNATPSQPAVEQEEKIEDNKMKEDTDVIAEVVIQGDAKREFYRQPGDTVPEVLEYKKEICSRFDANPTIYADHIPEGATGIVIEFEMKDCTVEFDKVMWYAEFETDIKNHSLLETKGMPQYEGDGTYRAVLNFSEFAPNETFKQLNILRIDWDERNNTLSENELAGEFTLTKFYYYTGNDIKDVNAEMLNEGSSEITSVGKAEIVENEEVVENAEQSIVEGDVSIEGDGEINDDSASEVESIDLTNTTVLNIGESRGYTLEMPVFTFAFSEKRTYDTSYRAVNSENDGREMYELYDLCFQESWEGRGAEEGYKKVLEDYNDWSGNSVEMGHTESAEIIGDSSSRYILAYSVGKIKENGSDFEVMDSYAIYDSEVDVIYEVTLRVIKDSALYGKDVMKKSTETYREELRNAMIGLTNK